MKKDSRIYLRLPDELKQEVQEYADKNHTTVSDLVIRFFTKLLAEDRRLREHVDAEQI